MIVKRLSVGCRPPSVLKMESVRSGLPGCHMASIAVTPRYMMSARLVKETRVFFWPYFWLMRRPPMKNGAEKA